MIHQANKVIPKALRMNAIGCIEPNQALFHKTWDLMMSPNLLNTLREQFVICNVAWYITTLKIANI